MISTNFGIFHIDLSAIVVTIVMNFTSKISKSKSFCRLSLCMLHSKIATLKLVALVPPLDIVKPFIMT